VILEELSKRRVFRVLSGYAVVCFVALQIADVTFEPLGISQSTLKLIIALMLLCLPLVAYFAWVFDFDSDTGVTRTASTRPKLEAGVAGAVLLLLTGLGWWIWTDPYGAEEHAHTLNTVAGDAPAIAVLPFEDLSTDGERTFFGKGISIELINKLALLDGLLVAGQTSSFSFQNKDVDTKTIAKALQVNWILEGSVQKKLDQLLVTAQLIDPNTGFEVWSDTYSGEVDSIFNTQSRIANGVAGALGVRLKIGGINAYVGSGTDNVEAYEYYLKSRFGGTQSQRTALIRKAIELDPEYGIAWATLGVFEANKMWTSPPTQAQSILENALRLVRKGVELAPDSAEALSFFGTVLYPTRNWIEAEQAYQKSLLLLRDQVTFGNYASMLMRSGRLNAAITNYDAALATNTWSQLPMPNHWYALLAKGEYAQVLDMAARFPEPLKSMIILEVNLNQADASRVRDSVLGVIRLNLPSKVAFEELSSVLNTPDQGIAVIKRIEADPNYHWANKHHQLALFAAYFGNHQLALELKTKDVWYTPVRLGAVWYPVFSQARQLPEFKELVEEIGLLAYWRQNAEDFSCR